LPNGEERAGTLEQLGEAFRAGLLGEETPVCAAGSDRWGKLVDVLAAASGASAASVWQVRLPGGETRSGTRQQLEEAIAAGHLTADLMALPSGATSWRPLGAILAGAVSVPPRPSSVAPAAVAPPAVAPPRAASVAPADAPRPLPIAAPTPSRPPPAATDDVWQVRLADGQIRAGTRAQLDEALRAGHLDASVMVLAVGATVWTPLSVAMAPPPAQPAPPPELAAAAPPATEGQAFAPPPELPATDTGVPPAPDTVDSLPESSAGEKTPVVAATDGPEPLWQVKLSERQLEAALEAGLVGDDVLVMPADTHEWIRLGDARRRSL
jgi:hypothetical protein